MRSQTCDLMDHKDMIRKDDEKFEKVQMVLEKLSSEDSEMIEKCFGILHVNAVDAEEHKV